MNCFSCKGNMKEGVTIHAMQLKKCIVVVKNVPCYVCENCGEELIKFPVARRLEEIAKEYEDLIAESKVVDYSAA